MDPVFIIAAIILFVVVFACLYGTSKNKHSTDNVMPSACDAKDAALEKSESDILREQEIERHKEYIQSRVDIINSRLNKTDFSLFDTKSAARDFITELLGIFSEVQDYVAKNKIKLSGCNLFHNKLKSLFAQTTELYRRSSEGSVLIAIIDTETTGLHSDDEPITVGVVLLEISGKKFDVFNEIHRYYGRRHPSVVICDEAYHVHGISRDSLAGEDFDEEQVWKCLKSADYIVAHNAKFDRRMLGRVYEWVLNLNWACSIESLRNEWSEITKGSCSLDSICRALNVNRPAVHHSLDDCDALIAALKTRSGKTDRSMTLFGRLIKKPKV
ncbi:3'-5' exonuclease [Laribacter hongkongensis]|uniref:3'-5' exonuclease n=1 Tax=Laribacter hongkongensis TaxID=168471 RepID=UPI0018775531|nr:3'-5' exonuclease [Laribacter hongkongensis]